MTAVTTDADWERRVADLWATFDSRPPAVFMAAMEGLAAERPPTDPRALFERASAHDALDQSDVAIRLYREALERGLQPPIRRQAVIQLASSLRVTGDAASSIKLLNAELEAGSDEHDDALRAFLALALVDSGRDREAVAIALTALAEHMPRYRVSVTAYARALVDTATNDRRT